MNPICQLQAFTSAPTVTAGNDYTGSAQQHGP